MDLAPVFGERMTEIQRRVLLAVERGHTLGVGDGVFVESTIVHGVHGDPNDIAVSFEWSDDKGYIWEVDFTEQSLVDAKIEGNRIQMIDSVGEEVVITVFQLQPANV